MWFLYPKTSDTRTAVPEQEGRPWFPGFSALQNFSECAGHGGEVLDPLTLWTSPHTWQALGP